VGVDGGGSRCTAIVARMPQAAGAEPVVVGRGHGGPANPRVAGHDTAQASLDAAIAAAFAAAGLPRQPAAAACLGLAGVGLAADREAVRHWAATAGIARRVTVVPDGLLPFADGAAKPWGVVLIAGTGSLALGRPRSAPLDAAMESDRCGGWGPLLGDEGSGYALGLAALKAVMRAADGRGPDTSLRAVLLERFGAAEPAALVARLHAPGVGRREIAAAARDTVAAADGGDAVATALVASAAIDLAEHVHTLATRHAFAAGGYPLRLAGGLLVGSESLRRLIVEALAASGLAPGDVIVVSDPAAGAVRLAATMTAS
jgi:N-acetylglucosamine kinase-like BadF-type ATPase